MRISDYEFNRMQLMKAIRRSEPIARTDLVNITGLAAGTITQLTADLVRRKILIESKPARPAFGRPRLELEINAKAAHVVLVFSAANGNHTIEIADLKGNVAFSRTSALPHFRSIANLAGQLARAIDETLKAASMPRADIARIGVLMHGIVDNRKGIVHWLATYPDREVPMAALIESRLNIPVVIDNSTNLIARAEHWFGEDEHLDDFSVMLVDLGLGSAHYVDGTLWGGAHGINSELGHIKIMSESPRLCYCGAHGCLAAYASMYGIVSQIAELRGETFPAEATGQRFTAYAAAARDGDTRAKRVFEQAGALLGTVAANLLHERDLGRLMVMTFDADLLALVREPFLAALKRQALPAFHAKMPVQFKVIDAASHYRKGCAVLALEQIHKGTAETSRGTRKPAKRRVKSKRRTA